VHFFRGLGGERRERVDTGATPFFLVFSSTPHPSALRPPFSARFTHHSAPPPHTPQEEYYLEQNVKKAIAIDEWSPGSLLSSMVDDVFFIVQKSCRRALATGNTQCACTVLGQGNGMLASQLRAALDARWKVMKSLRGECGRVVMGGLGWYEPCPSPHAFKRWCAYVCLYSAPIAGRNHAFLHRTRTP
jgi:hypothetical protein